MARPKKIVDPDHPLTPIQEIERKIKYHENCIAKLKAQKDKPANRRCSHDTYLCVMANKNYRLFCA